MKKRFLATLLIITMLFTSGRGIVFMAEETGSDNTFVTEEEARTVAINFALGNVEQMVTTEISGDLYTHGITETESEGFPTSFMINSVEAFYNYSDEISAYYVRITDIEGNPAGYIIVNASKNEYPIIEYAYDGVFYLDDTELLPAIRTTIEEIDEPKIYYNGKLSYAIEIKDELFCVNESGVESIDKNSLIQVVNEENEKTEAEKAVIKTEWDALNVSLKNRAADGIIVYPEGYESGFEQKSLDYCYGMPSSFYTMTQLSPSNTCCAPTAGTNLCYYWIHRDSTYSNVFNTSNPRTTFSMIYNAMGTTLEGTTTRQIQQGIKSYFISKGYESTTAYYSLCSTTSDFNNYIKTEINAGRPIIISVLGDTVYGNHAMLGVGYERFMYNGIWSSHYVRVADGWDKTNSRYVHYETSRDGITRVKVVPGL